MPKDKECFNAWKRVVPRADKKLTPSSKICKKHFHLHELLTNEITTMKDVDFTIVRDMKKLVEGAIPCQWPDKKNLRVRRLTRLGNESLFLNLKCIQFM